MKTLLRILRMAIRHKWLVAGAYASMLGAAAAYLVLPKLFGGAIDSIDQAFRAGNLSESTVLWTALAILGVSAVRGVLAFGQVYISEALGQATVYDIRNRFYDHIQRLSFGFHDSHHTGNLMSRAITDVEAMRMFISTALVRGPYNIVLFAVVLFLLLKLDWRVGLLSVGFMPFVAILSATLRLRLRRVWLRVQERMAELSTSLQENLTGVRVVKAFASEDFEQRKFNEKNEDVAEGLVSVFRLHALSGASMVLAYLATMGLILMVGGAQVINGHMSPGELAQFLFYMQILSVPVRQTGMMVSNSARALTAGERLFEILDTRSPVRESENAAEMPRARGHVRFEEVNFSYVPGFPVLKSINIEAEPGQVVALLGAPGSGKSTTVHLLPRFYDVDSGRVTIDGSDVRDVSLHSLRRNIGIVQQDVFLFTASIRENIAYGRQDAPIEDVIEAARVAQLHDFVMELENGYDTQVGERGVTLSGGQRQRLSIARAVLLDPAVLVLDDSTASVDAQTEEQIRKAMESVIRGRTTFVIANRLSTVHKADQILVLKEGRIAERGTHKELLALGGQYRDIYELQLRPQEEVMLEFEVPAPAAQEVTA